MADDIPKDLGKAQQFVLQALEWAYGKALAGAPGVDGAQALAADFLRVGKGDPEAAIDSLIRWQVAKAGIAGFATNIGGLLTLPAAIPANMGTVFFLQLRLAAAIAILRGYDPLSEQVKVFCMGALVGNGINEILKKTGVNIGGKFTHSMIMKIPGEVLKAINKAVGFRLVTKAGATGTINLIKIVPFISGLVAGVFDGNGTRVVGRTAKMVFVPMDDGGAGGPIIDLEPVPA